MVTFGEPLGHVVTPCGQILVSRTDDDPLFPCVDSKASPCVRSKRPRGAGIHGDVLNVHTGAS